EARNSWTIESGDADNSELIRRLELPRNDSQRMPAIGSPLSRREISILRRWIDAGAPWPDDFASAPHWAYVAAEPPAPPSASGDPWCRNPLDGFVLDRLRRQRL